MIPAAHNGEQMRERLLSNPKKLLGIAKRMGTDVTEAEEIYYNLENNSYTAEKWFGKLDEMVDLIVVSIIDGLKGEFARQGLREFDVEKHFLSAMLDLRRCTPESIRRAQESIRKARTEAQRLDEVKKETVDAVLESEKLLKEAKEAERVWSTRKDFQNLKEQVQEVLDILDTKNYELARKIADMTLEEAQELRDTKFIALRYAAKAGHVVAKLRSEIQTQEVAEHYKRLSTYLSTVKFLLEKEDYKTALLLARQTKHEAEGLWPVDKTSVSTHVCPICFDIKCPNEYCNLHISPSPLVAETCRTYCKCGTLYHICCVQKGEGLTCSSCHRPLKG
jgi:hypothetical protein